MSDLFEEDEQEAIELVDDFDDVDVDADAPESGALGIDARRRLERMLEEKRLREELDDFVDY